jgi:hypothetical protein
LGGTGQIVQLIHRAQDIHRTRKAGLAKGCQPNLSRPSFNQRCTQICLKITNLNRKRGLRHGTGRGRASEMAMACKRLEIPKLAEREIFHR